MFCVCCDVDAQLNKQIISSLFLSIEMLFFRYLKLEMALEIPASNDFKFKQTIEQDKRKI